MVFSTALLILSGLLIILALLQLFKSSQPLQLSIDFKQVIDQSIDVIYIYDARGYIRYVSPSVYKVLGYTPKEKIGKRFDSIQMSPESAARASELMARALTGEIDAAHIYIEHFAKNGSSVWTEQYGKVVKNNKDEVVAINTIMRDITSRRAAEQELKKSKELYKTVSEYAADVIYICDKESRISYVSPSVRKLIGFTPEERIGKDFLQTAVQDDLLQGVKLSFKNLLSGEIDETIFEMKLKTKAGKFVWAEVNGRAIKNDKGETEAVHAVARDISQRQLTELTLRNSEQQFRTLAERSLDPIVTCDSLGLIVYSSPAAQVFWGVAASELIGKHFCFALPKASRLLAEAAFEKMKMGLKINESLEIENVLSDGTRLWSQVRYWPCYDEGGVFNGFQFVARDITKKREYLCDLETRQQLLVRRAEQLLNLNEQLDAFSSTVSHDLQAPLRRISKYMNVVHKTDLVKGYGKEEAQKELREMSELVNYLLALSKSTDSKIHREEVNVRNIVNDIANRLRFDSGRNFNLFVGGRGELSAYANSTLVKMLLTNLVENSFKYTPRDRQLIISLESRTNEGITNYSYSDNGDGFAVPVKADLLEFNARGIEFGDFPGYGIGLATVNQIVRRHGGAVWIGNTNKGGACVTFSLGEEQQWAQKKLVYL